ncbi:MAG TPA: hypothetical protein ACFYD7_13580, partial [Candidatus Wujingus californicus]|uniref:hypothetical protein n=1 Tax=Candidatus Wujingus californicus TaxID=3367618 RepID=UPI0040294736
NGTFHSAYEKISHRAFYCQRNELFRLLLLIISNCQSQIFKKIGQLELRIEKRSAFSYSK